jgi:hypothetical protein
MVGILNFEIYILKFAFVLSGYCPIRKISVERQGTRVKRFFVSEARRAELENLTECRRSGTPGDLTGAGFWYFLREKVLLVLGAKPLLIIAEPRPCTNMECYD